MDGDIPLWFKVAYTGLLAVILPVYAVWYGWRNFLWFSDIALIGTGIALWLESSLIASMMAVAVLLPEVVWNVSYFARLLFGLHVSDLAGYMFDRKKPRFLRALSLFHIVLAIVLLWMLHRLGYDPRAALAQTLLAWIVLPMTYAAVRPGDENINWVYGLDARQKRLPPLLYLALVMLAYPIGLYLPTHFALNALFARG